MFVKISSRYSANVVLCKTVGDIYQRLSLNSKQIAFILA